MAQITSSEFLTEKQRIAILKEFAKEVVGRARQIVPRGAPSDEGNLRNMFDWDIVGETVYIRNLSEHAPYVEYGTGIHHTQEVLSPCPSANQSLGRIYPKHSKVLAWTDGKRPQSDDVEAWRRLAKEGKAHFATSIAGMKPQPFMRPAIHQTLSKVPEIIKAVLEKGN